MVRPWLVSFVSLLCLCCLIVRPADRHSWIAYAQLGSSATGETQDRRTGYVGDAACLPCHEEQATPYRYTSHRLTSQLPGKTSILGSFKDGKNVLMVSNPKSTDLNPRLFFKMDIEHGGYYQTAVVEGALSFKRSERIDIVIGSGVRGQTYLYWAGNKLYELPVSYWSDGNQWINSPNYKDGAVDFTRPVNSRCLECHASYIQPLSSDLQANIYDGDSLVAGISCESCHGAGADHVARERASSVDSAGSSRNAILNPAKFTRDRQIDQCALCHDGTQREELVPAFSYLPGKPLDEYLAADPIDISHQLDVHGNQVGLLKKSRCYLSSPSMSCSTCHDVHRPERAAAEYSDRCLSCHQWQSCGVSHTMGIKITHNCIDCHMPLQQTNAIVSVTANRILRTSIRTHWIKIYSRTANAAEPRPEASR